MSIKEWKENEKYRYTNVAAFKRHRSNNCANGHAKLCKVLQDITFTLRMSVHGEVVAIMDCATKQNYAASYFDPTWVRALNSEDLEFFSVVKKVVAEPTPDDEEVKTVKKPRRNQIQMIFDLAFELHTEDLIQLPDIRGYESFDAYVDELKSRIAIRKRTAIDHTEKLANIIDRIEKVIK